MTKLRIRSAESGTCCACVANEERKDMKAFRSIVLAAGIAALVGVNNASAQIDTSLEFTTSFPFTVGNATLPAGSYTIGPADDEEPKVLRIEGAHASAFFLTESAQPKQAPSKTEIVFSRYGDRYVLKSIWLRDSAIGYQVETALGERHAAKSGGASTAERVTARKTTGAR
jgi:hypothetical protein